MDEAAVIQQEYFSNHEFPSEVDLNEKIETETKQLSLQAILSFLDPAKEINDKEFSPQIISTMISVLQSCEHVGVKLWILQQIVKNEKFYLYWRETKETRKLITQLLLTAIEIEFSDHAQVWMVRRLAQRVLVKLGQLSELDMQFLQDSLEKTVYNADLSKFPLSSSVALGTQGDVFCWALLVMLQLQIGNIQKNRELAICLYISVPLLDPQLRTDILQCHLAFVRTGVHPRWLIEANMKGVQFKDAQQPHWIQAEYSGEEIKQAKDSILFQQKIVGRLSQLSHDGFCHCTDYRLGSYSRIGTFYRLLLALCADQTQVVLWLSEVGPYVYIMTKEGDNAPKCIKDLSPNKSPPDEIIQILNDVITSSGGKIMKEEELDVNLTDFGFHADLGYVANRNDMKCDVFTLLFICTD